MNIETVINRFNRGEVDPDAIARFDVETAADSCALMENFLPARLGPMFYRPGFQYLGPARVGASNRALIPFTRGQQGSIMLEFADGIARPIPGGEPIQMSPGSVSFTNEGFVGATGWSSAGSVTFLAGGVDLYSSDAYVHQTSGAITPGTVQTFAVEVDFGSVVMQVGNGSTVGGSDLYEAVLQRGFHFITFTPTSTSFSITFRPDYRAFGDGNLRSRINSCEARTSGVLELPVPNVDYRVVSYDISADVMFIAPGKDHAPRVIKRTGELSFSVEYYQNLRGPYKTINISELNVYAAQAAEFSTITASDALFSQAGDPGRLFKLVFPEQLELATFTSVGQTTSYVTVLGDGDQRELLIRVTGASASNVVSLRRTDPKSGVTETIATYRADTSEIVTDKFDGERRRYQLVCDAYSSGTLTAEIQYVSLAVHGHGLITGVGSATVATLYVHDVVPAISAANPTVYWYRGAWGPGEYPQGVTIYEGRLVWASKNRVDMTITDDYYSFDTEVDGPSAGISRTIGFGAVEDISWLESGGRLFMGLPTTEVLVRSTNFDEPLTPLNTNLKPGKGVGSSARRAVPDENNIYFVSRDGTRIHSLSHTVVDDRQVAEDLMLLHPSIAADGIESMALSKNPEGRLWVVSAGELRVLLVDRTEAVQGWSRVITNGTVLDVAVMATQGEDQVWILVERAGGVYIEQLAEYVTVAPMDSYKFYLAPGVSTLTGLDHLEGQTVGVWADGQDRGDRTVTSGSITIDSAAYTQIYVGLRYAARYQSNKITDYTNASVFTRRKTVQNTALVLRDYSPSAVTVGRDFDNMVGLPNQAVGPMVTDKHTQPFGFNGASDVDPRICIKATGPCKVMALAYQVDQSDNAQR